MANPRIEILRDKANRLPLLPGVYIMKDSSQSVIYVGKAKALKNRVTSYFRGEHLPKVEAMVQKVFDFDVIIASSEFEALVLENSLIKRHMPHYNILLKDDKGYPFIRIDEKEPYPVMTVAGRAENDGAKYFGPFGGRSATFEIIDTICKTLKLPTCSRRFPRDIGKARPCLNLHLGNCRGYCLKDASADEYRAEMRSAELILTGKASELMKELERKMYLASDEMRFELAAEYRDRLRAVQKLSEQQKVIALNYADTDAVGFYRGAKTCFSVLHYCGGNLTSKDLLLMEEPLEEDDEALSELLIRHYGPSGTGARTIILPMDIPDRENIEKLISEASGHAVHIETPKRGVKHALALTAEVNAREESERASTKVQKRLKTLEWLQQSLALSDIPHRIESFDISNLRNFGIVSAMVVFRDGKPLKRDYRRFHMKTVTEQDDYASMYETVTRRYTHCIQGDDGFEEVPDLVLIDGGQVHAQTAVNALSALGLQLPVFGMVKDDRHRTRALITPEGQEIGINGNPAVFSFIGTIQEETHRFAIEYQRSLRSSALGSELDEIPGIGPKRRSELLTAFKSVKAVRAATLEELERILPKNAAQAVYNYYHPTKEETT